MHFEIRDDRLHIDRHQVAQRPARDVGGRIVPTLIVLHDTAGGLDAEGSISWLAGNPGKSSAHVVVALDGTITQLAPFDRKTNHAGKSSWRGREFCNGFAIGIEIVNPGLLRERGAGAVADFGKVFDKAQYHLEWRDSPEHGGPGWWMPYSPQQLIAVEMLIESLARTYPSITEVVGHHHISPKRKIDPTPLMPWQRMRNALANAKAVSPVAPRPIDDTDKVTAIQVRLKELGYYTGLVDGLMGARTAGAITAFQVENSLPTTGKPDSATVRAIEADSAKAMPTGHREEATPAALVEQGSVTMASAISAEKMGMMQMGATAVTGVLVAVKSLIQEAGIEILIVCGLIAVAVIGWRQMRGGSSLAAHRLEEHKQGIK